MMSPDLIAFLKAWHEWATTGAPEDKPFTRKYGLCTNLGWTFGLDAKDDLFHLLERDMGDAIEPFGEDYAERRVAQTQHECPKRLAWVRAKLAEAGELVA